MPLAAVPVVRGGKDGGSVNRFRILRRIPSGSLVDAPIPSWGNDATTLSAPSAAEALRRAKRLHCVGQLEAIEVDEDHMPVRRGAA